MKTSNRALFLANYLQKWQLSDHLEISRPTFDLYLKNGKWKKHQIKKIDKLFEEIKIIISNPSNKEIIKINIENSVLKSEIIKTKNVIL